MRFWKSGALCSLFIFLLGPLHSQSADYFQQKVEYLIEVELDDQDHLLKGSVKLNYFNHSPDTLSFLYFHLWGNAYQNRQTALARQEIRRGDAKFFFAEENKRGGYEMVEFLQGDSLLQVEPDPTNPDIVRVFLPASLLPQGSIELTIPFVLKIPASFSRLGRIGTSYQLTQWYPKPAVYDMDGWHPVPYLDFGEFYSEFGSFDVRITLPENYWVAATGTLQTVAERQRLTERVAETHQQLALWDSLPPKSRLEPFPPSSDQQKTLRFTADDVHDFAWFADKRFWVLQDTIQLDDEHQVETWSFFPRAEWRMWRSSLRMIEQGLRLYHEQVGPYPYPQMTAVLSPFSAGGGMEYPMITVLSWSWVEQNLDETIAHEIGHNWFYGILGSNERNHPWLDEGLNSFYEWKYTDQYYGKHWSWPFLNLFEIPSNRQFYEWDYLFLSRQRMDQAPDTPAEQLSEDNYWEGAYTKPAWSLLHLENYWSAPRLEQAMKHYYDQWKFRHPDPEAFQQSLEQSGGESLDWWMPYLTTTKHLDYALTGARRVEEGYEVRLQNKGRIAAPFPLVGQRDGEQVVEQWYGGFEGDTTVLLKTGEVDRLMLDPEHVTLDLYRRNDQLKTKGLLKKVEPIQVIPGFGWGRSDRSPLFLAPALGWNTYDETLIGLALYNHWQLEEAFEWALVPMWSIANGRAGGSASLRLHLYPEDQNIRRTELSLNGRSFSYFQNPNLNVDLRYWRLAAALRADFRTIPGEDIDYFWQWRSIFTGEETPRFEDGNFTGRSFENRNIHELSVHFQHRRGVNPYSWTVATEFQLYPGIQEASNGYWKLWGEWKGHYTFRPKKQLSLRLFAGGFLVNTARDAGGIFPGALNLTGQGYGVYDDYKYDDFFFGRNDNTGLAAQQIALRDGGFKNAFGNPFRTTSGNTNHVLVAANLKTDLPLPLPDWMPIKPYFDLAYVADRQPSGEGKTFADQLWWSGGICWDVEDGLMGLYLPLFSSTNIQSLYDQQQQVSAFSRMTFSFNLNRLNFLKSKEMLNWF
jgi:hypothetical protein